MNQFKAAENAIKAAFPTLQIVGNTAGNSACGGDFGVILHKPGSADVTIWTGPQSDLSNYSGKKEATCAQIVSGLRSHMS